MVQLRTDPPVPEGLPHVVDIAGNFYFKPEAGGRLWLTPHDESPSAACDIAPEEWDVAVAIDRLEKVVDWRVEAVERRWAGLRSFAPDRAPVYGFDHKTPGFFWCAGQGGFGIRPPRRIGDGGGAAAGRGDVPEGWTPNAMARGDFLLCVDRFFSGEITMAHSFAIEKNKAGEYVAKSATTANSSGGPRAMPARPVPATRSDRS